MDYAECERKAVIIYKPAAGRKRSLIPIPSTQTQVGFARFAPNTNQTHLGFASMRLRKS